MTAAVLIAGTGSDDRVRIARIVQAHDLCRRLGLDIDLVLVTEDGAAGMPPVDRDLVRQFGCFPAKNLAGDRTALSRFLGQMNDGMSYALAHVCIPDVTPWRSAAQVWIADCVDRLPAQEADLYLSPIDVERAVLANSGNQALRLPLLPLTAGPIAAGRAVGWIGAWSDERVEIWTGTLERLSRHGIDLSDGIVLMGPGADRVAVPDNLSQWASVSSSTGHISILGLIAAPGPPLPGEYAAISECLSIGRPALLSSEAAALHEDRWRLPVADTAEDLFQMISDWRGDPSRFLHDLDATRRAVDLDLEAMTLHAAAEIAKLIGVDLTFAE